MHKRLILLASVAALLGLLAAAVAIAGHPGAVAVSVADPDMLVPATNAQPASNWKAQPVKGAPVNLPWANVRVNTDTGSAAQNEPFVAVDPRNSQHLVVGANNWLVGSGHFEAYAYTSFDGGHTWAASQPYINRNASRLNTADPTVAFGPDGSVYYAFVAFNPAAGAVAVSRSVDGGLSWTTQSWATNFASEAADKPALVAGAHGLTLVYQGSALYARGSADNGATWSGAGVVDAAGRNGTPVVDGSGNVSIFYATSNSIRVARAVNTDSLESFNITTVASVTALQPRQSQYRASIYPAAAVGPKGQMYVAWADGRNVGHGNDIMYSSSANGSSWSAPTVLNTDGGNADQLMPALSAGADGSVTVAWLDTRNDANNVNYDVYMARSTNGTRFGANTRVTDVSSNPNNDPYLQGSLIGDYFALAVGNGVVYPTWTDTRNGNEDIFLAPIKLAGIGSSH
jgi:hypothetical protein